MALHTLKITKGAQDGTKMQGAADLDILRRAVAKSIQFSQYQNV